MKIWLDAQLSPALAKWLNKQFEQIEAKALKDIGLRDASDIFIFEKAREQDAIVMTKDDDFVQLVKDKGTPPQVIWITCGNTSNAKMQAIFNETLVQALKLLDQGESIVEISDKTN